MYGLFEHIASHDEGARVASRKAAAVAQKRVADRFGKFLSQSKDSTERLARLDLIEDDLRQIVADVADEFDADHEKLKDAIDEHLKGDGIDDIDKELEKAPSAVGSKSSAGHASDCTCGFCQNKGNLPGTKDDDEDAGSKDKPEDKSKDESDTNSESDEETKEAAIHEANQYVQERDGKWVVIQKGTGKVLSTHDSKEKAEGSFRAIEMNKHGGSRTADADRDGGGAVTTEKLPKGDETALGGPSPKIDRKRWKPNALNEKGNLPPVDTETKGTPFPTEQQDIDQLADHTKDFKEQSEAATTQQELPTADENGYSTERNISQDGQSGTWHTNDGADPVTSEVMASTNIDVNPLKAILDLGFTPETQVESAIQAFQDKE